MTVREKLRRSNASGQPVSRSHGFTKLEAAPRGVSTRDKFVAVEKRFGRGYAGNELLVGYGGVGAMSGSPALSAFVGARGLKLRARSAYEPSLTTEAPRRGSGWADRVELSPGALRIGLPPELTTNRPLIIATPAFPSEIGQTAASSIYEVAEKLRVLAFEPTPSRISDTCVALRRTVREESLRRPRHASVALALVDALRCTPRPLETSRQRRVLWEASGLLTEQVISTDNEMRLLDRLDESGFERVPPFEETLVGDFFRTFLRD